MLIVINKIKVLVLIFNISLFITPFLANAQNKDRYLSSDDIKIYKKIFEIQKKPIKNKKSKEWKQVDRLISKLKNKILLGNVYAERYLHPTGWRSSYEELRLWLEQYNDHPDATRIARIAKKRKPKKSKNFKEPTPGFLNGYGTYKKNLLKPAFPIDNKRYKKYSYSTSIKFRRAINKKNTEYAENLLNNKEVKRFLTKNELSQLRSELSYAYFIFGKDYKSLRQASISLSL